MKAGKQSGAALTEAAVAIALLLVVFLIGGYAIVEGSKVRAHSIEDAVGRTIPCPDNGEGLKAGGVSQCL